jgi:hypothetical protein
LQVAVEHFEDVLNGYYRLVEEKLGKTQETGGWMLEKGRCASDMYYFPWMATGTRLGVSFSGFLNIQRRLEACEAKQVER